MLRQTGPSDRAGPILAHVWCRSLRGVGGVGVLGSRESWLVVVVGTWCGSLLVAAVVGESVLAVVVGRAGGGRRVVGAAAGS